MSRPDEPGARPARVALIQTQAEAAGAQEVSRLLADALVRRGHTVRQLFFYRKTAAFDGDPTSAICAPTRPSTPTALLRMLGCFRRELRAFRPDVAICFQHYGNLIGGPMARLVGVPCVVANHNGLQDLLSRPVVALDRVLGTAGIYDAIVVNSAETMAEYDRYPDRYRRRLSRIDHGFQAKTSRLEPGAARRSFGLPSDVPLLGCVARLAPKKNQAAAVRLLGLRPDWHLALAGQGPSRDALLSLARDLRCQDRLHLVGELTSDRVGDFLSGLDCFVFPSVTETFGLAAVEAAAAGIPVVANDLDVLREVLSVDGQEAARFVDPENTAAFAAAVAAVLEDRDLRTALTGTAAGLRERFPVDGMADAYEELIRTGLRRQAGRDGRRPSPDR